MSAETRIGLVSEVDRPGVRVALVAGSASGLALTKALKHASIVRGCDLSELIELVMMGEADVDVTADQKTNLYNIAPRVAGSRVLDGRPGTEEQALAIPKGRDPIGLAYVRGFVEDAKNRGLVFSGHRPGRHSRSSRSSLNAWACTVVRGRVDTAITPGRPLGRKTEA